MPASVVAREQIKPVTQEPIMESPEGEKKTSGRRGAAGRKSMPANQNNKLDTYSYEDSDDNVKEASEVKTKRGRKSVPVEPEKQASEVLNSLDSFIIGMFY